MNKLMLNLNSCYVFLFLLIGLQSNILLVASSLQAKSIFLDENIDIDQIVDIEDYKAPTTRPYFYKDRDEYLKACLKNCIATRREFQEAAEQEKQERNPIHYRKLYRSLARTIKK